VTERQPTPEQMEDLKFAWRAVKHVKSNAITLAKDRLLGMGSGQPNRVKSVNCDGEGGRGCERGALASDAFFPFAWGDSIEKACQAGVAAIAHPGGACATRMASTRNQYGWRWCSPGRGTRH
jgi:phosphoribosylaminoimidazolecarboxamide formyltransferase/IMP cyclohydrolase